MAQSVVQPLDEIAGYRCQAVRLSPAMINIPNAC